MIRRLKNRYKEQWDENKILPNMSWDVVKKELKYSNLMVKLYLVNRIYGKIVSISNTDMENKYIYLDSAKFIGITEKQLYAEYGLI